MLHHLLRGIAVAALEQIGALGEIVVSPYLYAAGSLIEIYSGGYPFDGAYPQMRLWVGGAPQIAWGAYMAGHPERREFQRQLYLHPSKAAIQDVLVEHLGDELGGPNLSCLDGWALEWNSTAVPTYHFVSFERFAKLTLTGPSAGGNPSAGNSLQRHIGAMQIGNPIYPSAQFRCPAGTVARLEFYCLPWVGGLGVSAQLEGNGTWQTLATTSIEPNETHNEGELRCTILSPDDAGSWCDWREVHARQEQIFNPDFSQGLNGWSTNEGAKVTAEALSANGVTFARVTKTGTGSENPSNDYSLCQNTGPIGADKRPLVWVRFRAPLGVVVRLELFAIPWTEGLLVASGDFNGTGDWAEVSLGQFLTTESHNTLELRLIVVTETIGAYADFTAVANTTLPMLSQEWVHNGDFGDKTLVIDRVVVDGREYEAEADNVWNTGHWIESDGANNPVAGEGYRESEQLTNNGALDFSTVPADDAFLAEADARIDQYRKADCSITVLDAESNPIVGATVEVTQTRHEFLFGCNLFLWGTLSEQLEPFYRARFAALFNLATLPFYWWTHEPEDGELQTEWIEQRVTWCTQNGITPKGHACLYNLGEPDWLSGSPAEVWTRALQYVSDVQTAHAATIDLWDVVNEASLFDVALTRAQAPKLTEAWRTQGQVAGVNAAFTAARGANANGTFLINDYETNDRYAWLVPQVSGCDVIGVQAHQHAAIWSLQKLQHVLDRFGGFDKPVHITETTICSGYPRTTGNVRRTDPLTQPLESWPTTSRGEARQALEVERFYRLAFSHPDVAAISWWDLSDLNAWLGAPGGLLRADMSPKLAYWALERLIKQTWWTRETLTTNSDGDVSFRGFRGSYDVRVKVAGQTVATDTLELIGSDVTTTITVS